jgi:hypothetical protein
VTRATTPKLKPTFTILIANSQGSQLSSQPDASSQVEDSLSHFLAQVVKVLPRLVNDSPLLYGPGAENHTNLVLLSSTDHSLKETIHVMSSRYGLTHKSIIIQPQSDDFETHDPDEKILLGTKELDPATISQLKSIQEDAFRAFSDMLLWIGGPIENPGTSNTNGLLIDCILDSKPIIHLSEEGHLSLLDYLRVDEPERVLLKTRKISSEHLLTLFKPIDDLLIHRELQFIVNPALKLARRTPRSAEHQLYDYFSEKQPRLATQWLAGRLDKVFQSMICLKGLMKSLFQGVGQPWYGVDASRASIRDREHPMEPEELRENFAWSDTLANVYAGIRRDTTWTLYLLSSLAVFAAVAGTLRLWPYWDWFWPTAELIIVLLILVVYVWASGRDLHGRWLFHRFLAEQIRYTRYGYPMLTFQMPLMAPLRLSVPDKNRNSQIRLANPESWILKRILVSAGPPRLYHEKNYRPIQLIDSMNRYVSHVINDQRVYHAKTHQTMHKMEHRLHTLTKLGFIVTALAVAAHFYVHAPWLLIFTAALPSLAAAIHGIVTTNEMGRVADLSKRTGQKLHHLQQSLARIENPQGCQTRTWLELREITHQSASVMSNVNQQWQELIQHHETSLPA